MKFVLSREEKNPQKGHLEPLIPKEKIIPKVEVEDKPVLYWYY